MTSRKDVLRFQTDDRVGGYTFAPSPSYADTLKRTWAKPLGEGGSAAVFKVRQTLFQNIEIARAMKFFYYRDDIANSTSQASYGPISVSNFTREVSNIANLNHRHLVRIIDAGFYKARSKPPYNNIPYIVYEFIDGPTLKNVLDACNESLLPDNDYITELVGLMRANPVTAVDRILQVCEGVNFMHLNGYYHFDIAPKNVFVDRLQSGDFVLGDLGISRKIDDITGEQMLIGSLNWTPPEYAPHLGKGVSPDYLKATQPRWDIYGLAKTSRLYLDAVLKGVRVPWIAPIFHTLDKVQEDARFISSVQELIDRLHFLSPTSRTMGGVPELSTEMLDKQIKLMPVQPLITTRRLNEIVTHGAVKRLASVPQLTMAYRYFPGANHTRYEHCLGVTETMRLYLSHLIGHGEFLQSLSTEGIETSIIASIVSNLHWFPLSNVFEEIFFQNNVKAGLLSRSSVLDHVLSESNGSQEDFRGYVNRFFPRVDFDRVRKVVLGDNLVDDEDIFIHSLLNSSLDVRVIDFIRRDAFHLGVTTGFHFTIEELLRYLTVHESRLAIKRTGVSVAEQVLMLRYWLFQRVYWNKPNRRYVALLRSLIYDIADTDETLTTLRNELVSTNEKEAIELICSKARALNGDAGDLTRFIVSSEDRPFSALYDVPREERPHLIRVFEKIDTLTTDELVRLEIEVGEFLFDGRPEDRFKKVLIDLPREARRKKLGEDIRVISNPTEGVSDTLRSYSSIIKGLNESFDGHLRRLRVWIHPEVLVAIESSGFDREHYRKRLEAFLEKRLS